MKLFSILRSVAWLWLGVLFTPAIAQVYPTIAPSRIIVTPKIGTSANEVSTISWKPGDGTNYIVLIRYVDPYALYGNSDMILPDDRPYATNGNGIMDANSRVAPNPYYGPGRSTTYLLKTATYSSPADTMTAVLNATGGLQYEVNVFEYDTDANGTRYYSGNSSSRHVLFYQPRTLPTITKLIRGTADSAQFTTVRWQNQSEVGAIKYRLLWSSDSTDMTQAYALNHVFDVQAVNYLPYTYSATVQSPYPGNQAFYFWLVLYSNANYYNETVTTHAYALAKVAAPLPVSLTSFDVARSGANVLVRWTTASEANNAGFGIERSADGSAWSQLDYVPGHGTTQQAHIYTRSSPSVGAAYYRLTQVDLSGAKNYSPVHYLAAEANSPLSIYPNPAQGGRTTIGSGNPLLPIVIYNTMGQPIQQLPVGTTQLDLTGQGPGIYTVRQGTSSVHLLLQ